MKVHQTKTKQIGRPENVKPYVVVGVGVLVIAVSVYQLVSGAPGNLLQSRLDPNATQEAAHPGSTKQDQTSLVVDNIDSDSDGITDAEEERIYHTDPLKPDTDGDGFSDGQEVKTGHDPKVNESGVKTISQSTTSADSQQYNRFIASNPDDLSNIDPTKYLSQKDVQDLQSGNLSNQSIEKISTLALANTATSQTAALPTIPDSALNITTASGKQAVQQYLFATGSVLLQVAPFTDQTQLASYVVSAVNGDKAKVQNLLSTSKTAEAQLKTIPVPQEMVDVHKKAIGILQLFQQSANTLLQSDSVDPSIGLLATNQLRVIANASEDLKNDIQKVVKKYKINISI